ncbi:MAG: BLUF domain-containing protein [Woeseiaceae bacterium]|nr:BLUF domain-containing protein [Woeseiaceae bacterium]
MRGVVYVSEALVYFDKMALESLAAEAAALNFDRGITGYLYFEKDRFVQYIEGDDDTIEDLMEVISRDKRHRVLHAVVEHELKERRFPSWHMRQLRRKELLEVKLEHLLTDYLVYLDSKVEAEDDAVDEDDLETKYPSLVWGMVNRLSDLRGKLGAY